MSVIYSQAAINARLQSVVTTIDAGAGNGVLVLLANSTPICSITLAKPSGSASGGVLTFNGPLTSAPAVGTGSPTTGRIQDSNGNIVISGLTTGIPLSGADIIISNGLNSTLISAGATVTLIGAQITGS